MTWYRQYRPQRVADLQAVAVRECWQNVLETGKFAQAYLLAGPRGIGKTSAARILARILNDPANTAAVLAGSGPLQEPNVDDPLLQRISRGTAAVVIEQDAASHRGIDDIRALQEIIATAPVEGVIRVVILDEVHMLSNDAFNALLKVIEEPPSRVVFILATTELHKVPATIQSRCQIVRMAAAAPESVCSVLESVAAAEKLTISTTQLQRLAAASNGSFRDGIKYLEQVVRDQQVQDELLDSVLGDQQKIEQLLLALAQQKTETVAAFFRDLRQVGVVWPVWQTALLNSLHERLQRAIMRGEAVTTQRRIVALLEYLLQHLAVAEAIDGLNLEVACLGWCLQGAEDRENSDRSMSETTPLPTPKTKTKSKPTSLSSTHVPTTSSTTPSMATTVVERAIVDDSISVATTKEDSTAAPIIGDTESTTPPAIVVVPTVSLETVQEHWSEILMGVRVKNRALEAVLRSATVTETEPGLVVLETAHNFHCEQLMAQKYRAMVEEVLAAKLQVPKISIAVRIKALVAPPPDVPASGGADALAQAVEAAVLSLG